MVEQSGHNRRLVEPEQHAQMLAALHDGGGTYRDDPIAMAPYGLEGSRHERVQALGQLARLGRPPPGPRPVSRPSVRAYSAWRIRPATA